MRVLVVGVVVAGCAVTVPVQVAEPNQAEATLVLEYEHGFEDYQLEWGGAEDEALETCQSWGFSAVEFSEEGHIECIDWNDPTPKGARPEGQSEEAGMGTRAAERERDNRNLGTVGQSVRTASSPPGAEYGCVRWRVTYQAHCVR